MFPPPAQGHSFMEQIFMETYYVSGTVLGEDKAVTRCPIPSVMVLKLQWRERDDKGKK